MYKKNKSSLAVSIACLLMSTGAHAGADDDLLGELSLEDLFSIETDIASNTSRSVYEQPSIISVITRDQVLNSGARDLIDILRMVPGFGFVHDTVGINTLGFRGIYGHEGKVMLLIDGAPFNDAAWGNLQLGSHYPVELIKKIEVIRGPGAAKFGNYAELAVIRITTVGKEMNGGFVDSSLRAFDDSFGGSEITAMYGEELDSGWGYSTSLHVKRANRTVLPLKTADGSISMDQNKSPTSVFWADLKVSHGDFQISTLVERHEFEHQESLGQYADPDMDMVTGYERFHLAGDYSTVLSEDWSLNANALWQETRAHDMQVTHSRPNENFPLGEFALGSHYAIDTERFIGSIDTTWTISENDSVSFGAEYFEVTAFSKKIGEFFADAGHAVPGNSSELANVWFAGADEFTFDQKSIFVQYENYNDIINFTLGLRHSDHSEAKEAITVPRIGLSKKWGDFGAKLMYSEAFRTGDAEHLNLASTQLEAETLDSTEVEFHYLHETGLYTVNFFEMNMEDAITFNADALTQNAGNVVSKGVEGSWATKSEQYDQEFTVSYYKGEAGSITANLAKSEDAYLGFPNLKLTWRMDYRLSKATTIHPTVMYEGKKWLRRDNIDISQDTELDAVILVNLTVSHKVNDDLTFQAGIHDLLDEGYRFVQAYGPINYPGDSREFSVSMQYKF
jgi:outer membrane cobalamin receptor